MIKLKKSSINKKKLKELEEQEIYYSLSSFTPIGNNKGYSLLSLKKMRKRAEFYKNDYFNDALRRKYNIPAESFEQLKQSFNFIRNLYTTRKAMLKNIKKSRFKEKYE
jgi:hypothetical protein